MGPTHSCQRVLGRAPHDVCSLQGTKCVTASGGGPPGPSPGGVLMVGKPLHDQSWALLMLNDGAGNANVTCDASCFQSMGWGPASSLAVRDIWNHKDMSPVVAGQGLTIVLPGGGSSAFVRLSLSRE